MSFYDIFANMRLKLNSAFRKAAVALLALLLATFIAISSSRSMAAWAAAQSGDWARASKLEPGNAAWRCNLGAYQTIVKNDPRAAIPYLEAGVNLNPHNAVCWTALGDAYAQAGDLANERRTLEAALRVEPNDAHIALNTATIYVNSNEVEGALPLYRLAIQKRPDWAGQILPNIWFHDPNAEELLARAIPPLPGPRLALLKLLADHGQWTSAEVVWRHIMASDPSFPSKDALFYVDALLANHDVATAMAAWQQLASRDKQLSERVSKGNLIVNPGFESVILNGGFDWIYQRVDGVDVSVDTGEFHSGNRSLMLNFDTQGLEVTGLKQFVPVEPGSRYSFSAWIRADSVESANGPRFAFLDPATHQAVFSMDDAIGSFPWRSINGEFITPPGVNLLELSVVRNPASSRIRGKVWIDDLELVRNP